MIGLLFDKMVKNTIEFMRIHQPPEGYYQAMSFGKDSCVVKKLCELGGIKHDSHYSVTTIDPPELIRFGKEHYPDTIWDRPEKPFLKEMVYHGAPRRQSRWCCEIYKEGGGEGRTVLTGIRWEESHRRRKQRKPFEVCWKGKGKKTLNPIIHWSERDVWLFIGKYNVPYCDLYDMGRRRLGCVFCPMGKQKERDRDVQQYPGFVKAFQRSFADLYSDRKTKRTGGIRCFRDGIDMWDWWISGKSTKAWCASKGLPYSTLKEWKEQKKQEAK